MRGWSEAPYEIVAIPCTVAGRPIDYFGDFVGLPSAFTDISPIDPLPEIWGAMKEAGATPLSAGRQQARVLQTRMVRAFKNYGVARSVWAHLVVPSFFAVPRSAFYVQKHFPVIFALCFAIALFGTVLLSIVRSAPRVPPPKVVAFA